MKSPSTRITLFAFLIGIVALTCHKSNDLAPYAGPLPIDYTVLPPATQEGKNTIGCKVNGKVWVPRAALGAIFYNDVRVMFSEKGKDEFSSIELNLVDIDEKIQDWMLFEFRPIYLKPMDYHTSSDTSDTKRFCVSMHRSGDRYNIDYSKTNYSNQFSITKIDTINNFFSGTFKFTVYNKDNPEDSLKITEGRFDLKY
jgi:hypothetical protein